ncbi:MarR family winged helix-turn-helix transcriptional regulator [Methylobacterium sp. ID0610]|uniref:MarR family winged helix-turn-helix transcriptional regulator n=1 Tax=Methylobacterium carpenticola TaxID=3344827 RepID=UPI00367F8E7D
MDRVEDCISFLVGKAAQQISRRARDALAGHGVTPPQYAVLKVLWERDGQSGAELGARLLIDSATITGLADRLQTAGLLERRPHGEDRRVNSLFLTPRGRDLQAPLDAAMDRLNDEVAREMGTQAEALRAALRRLGEARN